MTTKDGFKDRQVAPPQNPSSVLEAMETGENPIPYLPGVAFGGMAGTQTGELSKRHMESGRNAELCANKRKTSQTRISIHAWPVSESM